MQADIASREERRSPESLLARAQFNACLDALGNDQSPRAIFLRMRAMLCLGRHHDVVRADVLAAIGAMPQFERGRAMGLLGTAYFRSGMRPAAESAFQEAHRLVANDPSALAEVLFYESLLRWSTHDLVQAENLVQRLVPLPEWRAKALDVRSWIRASRGDYRGQLADLLDAYNSVRGEDVFEKAAILHSASALVRELFDVDTARRIAAAAEKLAWTAETSEQEFYTFRNLAWCFALAGQSLAAYDYLTRAERMIPSPCHTVLIHADRAVIARYAGESETSARFLASARYAAFTADWRQNGESRTALLLLAELVATEDPVAAKSYIEQYTAIRTAISPLRAFGNRDRRLDALEQYAAGVVYRANGEHDLAVSSLKRALKTWLEIGYNWRAALAAVHLGEIDRPHYADLAVQMIDTHVPHAFFAGLVASHRAMVSHPDISRLSPRRREILACFIDGQSNEQIARNLGLSLQTVKNALQYIFRYFGAHGARDLFPILRQRGII